MTGAIETHCETALESPYSNDRENAIEELGQLYTDVGTEQQRQILETLRQVATDATASNERALARETLFEAFETNPAPGSSLVVSFFCDEAANASRTEGQLDAIDTLRELYPVVDENQKEKIGATLAEIAGDGTYEDVRQRARQRLSDVTSENKRAAGSGSKEKAGRDDEGSVGYLGQSLAEHLEAAAHDSPEACLQRAEELRDFVAENPLGDETYEDVREEIQSLTEQLSVLRGDELDSDRVDRVERVANRVKRLYSR